VRRDEARRRADAEAAARGAHYGTRAAQKDRQLAAAKEREERERAARADDARARAEFNRQRAAQADAAERQKRERLASKLEVHTGGGVGSRVRMASFLIWLV
jgi:hypothetical protein